MSAKHGLLGDSPKGAHVAIMLKDSTFQPIPVGSVWALVDDPTKAGHQQPLLLLSVSAKELRFKCACGKADCTKTVTFKARYAGVHKIDERFGR